MWHIGSDWRNQQAWREAPAGGGLTSAARRGNTAWLPQPCRRFFKQPPSSCVVTCSSNLPLCDGFHEIARRCSGRSQVCLGDSVDRSCIINFASRQLSGAGRRIRLEDSLGLLDSFHQRSEIACCNQSLSRQRNYFS